MTESATAEPRRYTYVVSLTADEPARAAADLTISEAALIRSLAETFDGIGSYSGSLSIRPGGGPDPDCPSCAGSGRLLYVDGECGCMPTATVERRTDGPQ